MDALFPLWMLGFKDPTDLEKLIHIRDISHQAGKENAPDIKLIRALGGKPGGSLGNRKHQQYVHGNAERQEESKRDLPLPKVLWPTTWSLDTSPCFVVRHLGIESSCLCHSHGPYRLGPTERSIRMAILNCLHDHWLEGLPGGSLATGCWGRALL